MTDSRDRHPSNRPSTEQLLAESIAAIHAENRGRPIRCCCGCGVTYLRAATYMQHQSRQMHPSRLA